ncbi:MAG: hypothetical protein E6G97_18600 [Alphaproteobacteria bacterium]|nr:MAG: hypothetical protein E6G97_18600 [Alphaproteobacteria bacterium]
MLSEKKGRGGQVESAKLRYRLQSEQKDQMLRHALRLPELFPIARDRLKDGLFDPRFERHYLLTLESVFACVDRYAGGALPKSVEALHAMTRAEMAARLAAGPPDPGMAQLLLGDGGLLDFLFDETSVLDHAWGRSLLVDFLRERSVYDPLCELIATVGRASVPEGLGPLLEQARNSDLQLEALKATSARSAAAFGHKLRPLDKTSTGIDFLDDFMAGGDAASEVYGVLGGYGSGKTALAIQSCYAKSLQFQYEADCKGKDLQHCHLFTYEADYAECVRRFWAHAARIRMDSPGMPELEPELLSHTGQLREYERCLFAKEIAREGIDNFPGEFERLQAARELMARNVWVHDYSGADENRQRGTGYVDEIVAELMAATRDGRPPGAIFVDYAGLAAKRYLLARGRSMDELRHYVGGMPDELMQKVTRPFNCRAWLYHQLSAAANAKGFTSTFRYTDSAEAKNFGENVAFCFQLGVRDKATNCLQFFCDKTRRAKGAEAPVLLYLRGEINTLERATDMTINPSLGRPVSKSDASYLDIAIPPQGGQKNKAAPDVQGVADLD